MGRVMGAITIQSVSSDPLERAGPAMTIQFAVLGMLFAPLVVLLAAMGIGRLQAP